MRRTLAPALTLCVLLMAAPGPVARALSSQSWGLPQLMASLRRVKSASAQFVERKTMHLLRRPLVASGTLLYVAPDQVQKITVSPQWERLALSGDTLTMEGGPGDRTRSVSLSGYPDVAAFVEGVRATLAGDLPALERFYSVRLQGDAASWQLLLEPKRAKLRKIVQWIHIRGSGDKIEAVETEEGDGDHSDMTVVEDIHDAP
jgi:Outer membrane lipoprotein carrier protein LolA-like